MYPCLDWRFKAALSRPLLYWLSDLSARHSRTAHGQLRATCVSAAASLHHVLEMGSQFLTRAEVIDAQRMGETFLLSYSELASSAARRGVCNYKLLPKHHFYDHIVEDLSSRENPRYLHCFADEDFMGKISRIVGRCHRGTCVRNCFRKYSLKLTRMWRRSERRFRASL